MLMQQARYRLNISPVSDFFNGVDEEDNILSLMLAQPGM